MLLVPSCIIQVLIFALVSDDGLAFFFLFKSFVHMYSAITQNSFINFQLSDDAANNYNILAIDRQSVSWEVSYLFVDISFEWPYQNLTGLPFSRSLLIKPTSIRDINLVLVFSSSFFVKLSVNMLDVMFVQGSVLFFVRHCIICYDRILLKIG